MENIMKKIFAILLVLFVCAAVFVACGEKKDDTVKEPEKTEDTTKPEEKTEDTTKPEEKTEVTGNMFEGKKISFALPEGYKAEESEAGVNVSNEKDPMKAITITIQEGNSASPDEVAKITAEMLKDTKIEDAKIGNYDYKKLTTSMLGINLITLINSSNGNLYSLTVNGFEDPEMMKILESIELK
jgi:hypothetical protein